MRNNSIIWIVIIGIVLVIFLGLATSMVSIYFAKQKIEKGGFEKPKRVNTVENIYEAPSGQWSLNYPNGWFVSDEEDEDSLIIKNEPFSKKLADPDSIRINRGEITNFDEILTTDKKSLDYTEEKVIVDGVEGTKIDGVVKEDGESMYAPGTRNVAYYFELGDNDYLTLQTNSNFYAEALDDIVRSLKFDLQGEPKEMSDNPKSEEVSDSGNIKVYAPLDGDQIISPFILRGEAIAFESTINYTLYDDAGNELVSGYITTGAPDVGEFGEFTTPVAYESEAKSGVLEVYTLSAKDGSKQDLVSIELDL